MKVSKNGLKLLKYFEGVVPYEYLCSAGKPTISKGIRTDLLSDDMLTKYTRLVSASEVTPIKLGVVIQPNIVDGMVRVVIPELEDELIGITLVQYENCINECVTKELSQSRFDVLVSLVYNIGVTNFMKSSVLRNINANETPRNWTSWNKVGGVVNTGLDTRRKKEYDIYIDSPY